ncbi:MAG: ferritin family protein [Candidatus Aminicenantes bacterium]|jgi:rubrerythrin
MEFFEFALEMETKTIESYRTLAEKCQSNEGVKKILLMLAEDHEKHTDTLREMQTSALVEMEETEVFREARRVFSDMQNNKSPFSCDIDQVRLYEDARELVLKKRQFYEDIAAKLETEESRALVAKMAEEEKKQAVVLDNIIEMVRRPETWLEDAEFHHLDEY